MPVSDFADAILLNLKEHKFGRVRKNTDENKSEKVTRERIYITHVFLVFTRDRHLLLEVRFRPPPLHRAAPLRSRGQHMMTSSRQADELSVTLMKIQFLVESTANRGGTC